MRLSMHRFHARSISNAAPIASGGGVMVARVRSKYPPPYPKRNPSLSKPIMGMIRARRLLGRYYRVPEYRRRRFYRRARPPLTKTQRCVFTQDLWQRDCRAAFMSKSHQWTGIIFPPDEASKKPPRYFARKESHF